MSESAKRPNVIWVFGDQHRGQAMGWMGDPNVHTPNMDRMACNGVAFPNAVGGMPLCCPFRGSLVTSLYPQHCVPGHQYPMATEQQTIAHVLGEAGYRTTYFGKWHLDGFAEGTPAGRSTFHIVPKERRGGFDDWVGYDNNNSQWDTWVHGHLNGEEVELQKVPGYETDGLTDMFIEYLRARGTEARQGDARGTCERKPFFAALSVQPPHNPYVADEQWMRNHNAAGIQLRPNVAKSKRVEAQARRDLAGYYAQIENLDWNLGRILKTLEDEELFFDTHVIFFSDHGDMHGSHGQFKKMTPLEESLRIPFIIGGGRRYTMKTYTSDIPVNHVDIAPTTLGLCGVDVPDWMQGTDYSHCRLKKDPTGPEPDSAYIQSVVPTMHGDSVDRPWRGVVTRDGWKYVALEGQPWLMFDLNDDPYEQANLAHNVIFGKKRKELNDLVRQWIVKTDDEFELPEL